MLGASETGCVCFPCKIHRSVLQFHYLHVQLNNQHGTLSSQGLACAGATSRNRIWIEQGSIDAEIEYLDCLFGWEGVPINLVHMAWTCFFCVLTWAGIG